MKKILLLGLFFLIAWPSPMQGEDFRVEIADNTLTVHARNIPLQALLRRIALQGIHVRIDPGINPTITARFSDREIAAGLKTILKSTSHALIWETRGGAAGGQPALVEIQVFKPGEKERMRVLGANPVFAVARRGANGPFFVKGEVLVKIAPGADLAGLKAAIEKIGGEIFAVSDPPGLYKITFPPDYDVFSLTDQLQRFPGVARAEPNFAYPVTLPQKLSLSDSKSPFLSDRPETGEGVPVAVLDSGVFLTPDLHNRVKAVYNAFEADAGASDTLGHGTQMALIAAGLVTPAGEAAGPPGNTEVLPIKILDDNGFTTSLTILRSVAFAMENGARVLSLSWGSETDSALMEDVFRAAAEKGITIVAAAGNEPTGKPVYPAAYASVIGVGALDAKGDPWENSNYGEFVSFYAPGFATLPTGSGGDLGLYAGTSIATAYTANLLSGYLARNPAAGREDILDYLKTRGSPLQ